MSVRAAFTVENIYDNKRNDIYTGKTKIVQIMINKILKKIEWNFDVKD